MLLSDTQVRRFLTDEVVPCWEMVRPVPKVRIDFGSGKVLERTLAGNTILSLVLPDGRAVDALPGVYTPVSFLAEARGVLEFLRANPEPTDADLIAWHRQRVGQAARAEQMRVTFSKAVVESPLLKALGLQPSRPRRAGEGPATPDGAPLPVIGDPRAALTALSARIEDVSKVPASVARLSPTLIVEPSSPPPSPEELGRMAVAADSRINVSLMRPAVHLLYSTWERLPAAPAVRDAVFRELLHVNVDDPYLGLADALVPGTPPGR